MNPLHVIGMGMGPQDLTHRQTEIIKSAQVLVGGNRQLSHFSSLGARQIPIKGSMSDLLEELKQEMQEKKVVVLASGDPLLYGIGATLLKFIDRRHLLFHSNVSSVSAAFAAIKEPWHDAQIISLHGKEGINFSFPSLNQRHKVAFLTDRQKDPLYIANKLIENNIAGFKFHVLESIGHPQKERISCFENYSQVCSQEFSHPVLVILLKPKIRWKERAEPFVSHETHMGMQEDNFIHSKGLITKSEIRSISLSKLKLTKKDHIIWDIGSGSGSVSIEASKLVPWGQVYSIEKNDKRIGDIVCNIKKFNCPNIKILNLCFPEGMADLARPDRIFVGGGGRDLEKILMAACTSLLEGGVIVINTVLIQHQDRVLALLKRLDFSPNMVQVQISRSRPMPFGDRMEALNPVWIIWGTKPKNKKKEGGQNG